MPCIYVLVSQKDGKRYIGSSREDNCAIRLSAHNAGKVRSTKFGRPWQVGFEEYYDTYTEARRREIFLKTGQGRKYINQQET